MKKYLIITAILALGLVACSKKEEVAPAEMNEAPSVAASEVAPSEPETASADATPSPTESVSTSASHVASEPASAVAKK